MKSFLRTQKTRIVKDGRPVVLRGVNLGGWLMMEGYIMHAPNSAERAFKKNFAVALGPAALRAFEKDFRDHFIQEKDFRAIAAHGFNCIRLPFNCRLIEPEPNRYSKAGLAYLDRAVAWAKKHKLWVILDLHAAPGAQNHDWHSDSLGKAELWQNKKFQDRTATIWEFLADHFKDNETVAGYDLLNEAVLEDTALLNRFYQRLIKTIRSVDRRHILFVEGNKWAQEIECLDHFADDNVVLSVHTYQPLDMTFNFVPHLTYPLKYQNQRWDRSSLKKFLSGYKKISQKRSIPIYVGEFGVNYRQGIYGEDRWLADMLSVFNEFGFHWTYWTYKAMKNNVFPDGVLSFLDNPPWVNRAGPRMGWETYHLHWQASRKDMVRSWGSDSFSENSHILKALKNAVR